MYSLLENRYTFALALVPLNVIVLPNGSYL